MLKDEILTSPGGLVSKEEKGEHVKSIERHNHAQAANLKNLDT